MDRGEFSVFYRDTLVSLGMPEPSESDIDEAIQVLDKDKNNEIDYKEFSDWWRMMHGATQRRRARCVSRSILSFGFSCCRSPVHYCAAALSGRTFQCDC